MKLLTVVIMMFLFSGPTPAWDGPIRFNGWDKDGASGVVIQIRPDSTILWCRLVQQFKTPWLSGGSWKYSNATLEWTKTDETVTTYALDTIGYLAYLIPKASNEEYVSLREQLAACIKEGPAMKEMASSSLRGTPEEKRMAMRSIQYSDARGCIQGTSVLVETVEVK